LCPWKKFQKLNDSQVGLGAFCAGRCHRPGGIDPRLIGLIIDYQRGKFGEGCSLQQIEIPNKVGK
jgi:hypothetical protein